MSIVEEFEKHWYAGEYVDRPLKELMMDSILADELGSEGSISRYSTGVTEAEAEVKFRKLMAQLYSQSHNDPRNMVANRSTQCFSATLGHQSEHSKGR